MLLIDAVAHYHLQLLLVLPVTHTEISETEYVENYLEFSFTHGVILKGLRVVISAILWTTFFEELHEAHIGIGKMKSLARSYVWWLEIHPDIEQLVKSCISCQSIQN